MGIGLGVVWEWEGVGGFFRGVAAVVGFVDDTCRSDFVFIIGWYF